MRDRASSIVRKVRPLIFVMMSPTKTWPVAAAPPDGLIDSICTAPADVRLMLTPIPTLAGGTGGVAAAAAGKAGVGPSECWEVARGVDLGEKLAGAGGNGCCASVFSAREPRVPRALLEGVGDGRDAEELSTGVGGCRLCWNGCVACGVDAEEGCCWSGAIRATMTSINLDSCQICRRTVVFGGPLIRGTQAATVVTFCPSMEAMKSPARTRPH
jgi:hypothetical protein